VIFFTNTLDRVSGRFDARVRFERRQPLMPDDDPEKNGGFGLVRNVGLGIMVPGLLAGCIVAGCWLGYKLDQWLGSSPWGLLAGLVLGSAAAVRETIRILKKTEKNGD
jgi:ATP synthase protein I